MKVVNAKEMREIDRLTIEEYGLDSLVLMERAGLSVVRRIEELYDRSVMVVVLSGGGNNGGDGLVIARNLHNAGWDVRVFLVADTGRLSADCRRQYDLAKKMGVRISEKAPSKRDLKGSLIIDALLGTGLQKNVRGDIARLIKRLESADSDTIAVDIPSGISADNGRIMGSAVRADATVTFGLPKIGHLLHPGAAYAGRLFIEDIGFPPELATSSDIDIEYLEESDIRKFLPERPQDTYKGDYGHILILGGSAGKTGAPLMAAGAALKSGAGLVTVGAPGRAADALMASVVEEMVLPLPSLEAGKTGAEAAGAVFEFLSARADILAIGPGLGMNSASAEFALNVIKASPVPMVIDADGLNALSMLEYTDLLEFLKALSVPAVLTPHPGEMARLLKRDTAYVKSNRLELAGKFSRDTGTFLVLKGAPAIVAAPDGRLFINSTGNPGMATAGTGDVLTGLTASLIAQSSSLLDGLLSAVYLHGLAGDIAAGEMTEYSLKATDITESLPEAFKLLSGHGAGID